MLSESASTRPRLLNACYRTHRGKRPPQRRAMACLLTFNACCLPCPAETNGPAPQFVQSAPQMYYGAPPPQQAMY